MLAGEEERSCWQTQEESKNRAACKGCVYYTVYTWRKTPGEQTWSKRSCCHVDNTQTHSEKSGRTWSLLCQAVVTSDPLALQLEMMPARQLNVGQAKQTVCLNVFISVSVCLCVHRGVDPQWPITVVSNVCANDSKASQGWQGVDVRSFCAMSMFIFCVSLCCWCVAVCLTVATQTEDYRGGREEFARRWQSWQTMNLCPRVPGFRN